MPRGWLGANELLGSKGRAVVGVCARERRCTFAHSEAELRAHLLDEGAVQVGGGREI